MNYYFHSEDFALWFGHNNTAVQQQQTIPAGVWLALVGVGLCLLCVAAGCLWLHFRLSGPKRGYAIYARDI